MSGYRTCSTRCSHERSSTCSAATLASWLACSVCDAIAALYRPGGSTDSGRLATHSFRMPATCSGADEFQNLRILYASDELPSQPRRPISHER